MLAVAATNGNKELCCLARKWMLSVHPRTESTHDFDQMLICGAQRGLVAICELARY
jgi:hypothetical protein